MSPLARRLLVGVVGIAAIAATASLGFWQVRRGDEKTALQERVGDALRETPSVPSQTAWAAPATLVNRHVSITGRWLVDRVVYLDNRPLDGRQGLFVLMALHVERPSPRTVVVNRGWIPRDPSDRTRVAPYRTPGGDVTVTGVTIADEPRLLDLGTPPARALGGLWQNFDRDAFARLAGMAIVPLVVRQDADASIDDGLVRDWPDRGGTLQAQIDRHRGYAFQWFALAATLAALLAYQLLRTVRAARGIPR